MLLRASGLTREQAITHLRIRGRNLNNVLDARAQALPGDEQYKNVYPVDHPAAASAPYMGYTRIIDRVLILYTY